MALATASSTVAQTRVSAPVFALRSLLISPSERRRSCGVLIIPAARWASLPASAGVGMIAVRAWMDLPIESGHDLLWLGRVSSSKGTPRIVFQEACWQWQLFQVWNGGDAQAQQLPGTLLRMRVLSWHRRAEVAIAELR